MRLSAWATIGVPLEWGHPALTMSCNSRWKTPRRPSMCAGYADSSSSSTSIRLKQSSESYKNKISVHSTGTFTWEEFYCRRDGHVEMDYNIERNNLQRNLGEVSFIVHYICLLSARANLDVELRKNMFFLYVIQTVLLVQMGLFLFNHWSYVSFVVVVKNMILTFLWPLPYNCNQHFIMNFWNARNSNCLFKSL